MFREVLCRIPIFTVIGFLKKTRKRFNADSLLLRRPNPARLNTFAQKPAH